MTLNDLRQMRLNGEKPQVLTVICGNAPAWMKGDECSVFLGANEPVELLDFRPFVGLKVSVIDPLKNDDFLNRVLDAAQSCGALICGVIGQSGVVAETPRHEQILKRKMEVLCQT